MKAFVGHAITYGQNSLLPLVQETLHSLQPSRKTLTPSLKHFY